MHAHDAGGLLSSSKQSEWTESCETHHAQPSGTASHASFVREPGVYKTPEQVLRATSVALLAA